MARRLPLCTIGRLQRHLKMESFISWLDDWLNESEFAEKLEQLTQAILPLVPLQPSKKHMHGQVLGRLEHTPALKY